MTLVTGTPVGTITSQENTQIESSAYIYYQNASAGYAWNPDSNGWYWNLITTGSYPVYLLGCIESVSLGSKTTVNSVRCDTIGEIDAIQKLDHLQVKLTINTLFPLSMLQDLIQGSGAVHYPANHTEAMGIGQVNNNKYFHVYMPKVYDDVTGAYVAFTIHRAKFVNAWEIAMKYGTPWQLTGLEIWGFADTTKPAAQTFATVMRADVANL
jgi:hypothetical protein